MVLAQYRFLQEDLVQFATLSADWNPMHMDSVLARRTQAGIQAVHGIHVLLWALDAYAAATTNTAPLRSFRVSFEKFVSLGETVELHLLPSSSGTRLRVLANGLVKIKIALEFGDSADSASDWLKEIPLPTPPPKTPNELRFEQIEREHSAGNVRSLACLATESGVSSLYPHAMQWIGFQRIASLATSSCLVGMVCPGLHSIYSAISVDIHKLTDGEASLSYRVSDTEPRFQLISMEIAGNGLSGKISAFVRTPPVPQADMEILKKSVGAQEFAGTVALIVGGSRGLGELTAKILAAGGGHAIITWLVGKSDAEKVAEEIRAAGGLCTTLQYDTRKSAVEQLALLADVPTHAYFFATPPIFRAQAQVYTEPRFHEFLSAYVDGFWNLAKALQEQRPNVSLFYPSSVAVDERPKGMTEYTMAKVAGEVLCADINTSLAPIHVTVNRLPRLATDQTTSVMPTESADTITTMLPIIREVQSWPKA